ncbi:hypothetical protein [Dongia deserti]|uniref:hypothetical protein n=1 Tax=Dongia deserti TaxID=2268030 RepID=UPI000E65EA70|nr:hypothetical protein [Dongia deserti]
MFKLFRREKHSTVSVGSRYYTAGLPYMVWEVVTLFEGIDGTPYAHIVAVNDPTRRKTVAQSSLESGAQYVPAPDEE